jgi:hypothetical protein
VILNALSMPHGTRIPAIERRKNLRIRKGCMAIIVV